MENIVLYCDGDLVTERDFKICYDYSDDQYNKKIWNNKTRGFFWINDFKFCLYDKSKRIFLTDDKKEKYRTYNKITHATLETRTFKRGTHKRVIIMNGIRMTVEEAAEELCMTSNNLQMTVRKYKEFTYGSNHIKIEREEGSRAGRKSMPISIKKNTGEMYTDITTKEAMEITGLTKPNLFNLIYFNRVSKSGWKAWKEQQ